MKNGLINENDSLIYYKDDVPCHAGLVEENGDIYYIGTGGRAVKGWHTIHTTMANGLLKSGKYQFGDDYKLVERDPDKNGLFAENGQLIYYKDGYPKHAGVIKEGKDIYYIGSGGRAVKGKHVIHQEMANGVSAGSAQPF